jgi:hypothetical protein
MKNAVFVKDVSVPTDYTSSRNTSCRVTGLEIMMNRKCRVVPDRPRGNTQANSMQDERQAIFHLKVVMRKRVSI